MVTLQLKVVDGPLVDVNPIAAFSLNLLSLSDLDPKSSARLNLTLVVSRPPYFTPVASSVCRHVLLHLVGSIIV